MEKVSGGWGFGWLCSDLQIEVIIVYELESKIGSVIHCRWLFKMWKENVFLESDDHFNHFILFLMVVKTK
jgi:hypothetical protein